MGIPGTLEAHRFSQLTQLGRTPILTMNLQTMKKGMQSLRSEEVDLSP
jgi:hypothetical protein